MQQDINLLRQKKQNLFERENTLFLTRAVSILSLIAVCVCIGIFYILNKNYSTDNLNINQQSLESKLSQQKSIVAQQFLLVDKLNHIDKIISQRLSLEDKMSLIQQQLPPGTSLDTFSIDMKISNFTVSSDSLPPLQKFITSITALAKSKKIFKSLTINSISADAKTGKFSLSVAAGLL